MKTKLDYSKICADTISFLPRKSQEVLRKRFGLDSLQRRQTLQQVGGLFGVTRERARQIEVEALSKLRANYSSSKLNSFFVYFKDYLKKHGGLKREDLLLNDLGGARERNFVFFLLKLAPSSQRLEGGDVFYPFWVQTGDVQDRALALLNDLVKTLEDGKIPLSIEEVYGLFSSKDKAFVNSSIEASRAVEIGPLDKIGLVAWPEIKPRGVRDAAYLILKKLGRPLHFRDIAGNANGLNGHFFQKKKILPQTVHNELIRDPQFILVGRGTYALKEWGYSEGTVKDVIRGILEKNGSALTRQEILQRVLRQRIVQPNTILLNLNNKTCFEKDEEGRYTLKEI